MRSILFDPASPPDTFSATIHPQFPPFCFTSLLILSLFFCLSSCPYPSRRQLQRGSIDNSLTDLGGGLASEPHLIPPNSTLRLLSSRSHCCPSVAVRLLRAGVSGCEWEAFTCHFLPVRVFSLRFLAPTVGGGRALMMNYRTILFIVGIKYSTRHIKNVR